MRFGYSSFYPQFTAFCQSFEGNFYASWGRSAFLKSCFVWWVPLSLTEQEALQRFGAAVRRERTAISMTQERLAELTELHLRTVQKIEAGSINVLITTVQRVQRSLACPWESLLGKGEVGSILPTRALKGKR